jgi:hypothetical protein
MRHTRRENHRPTFRRESNAFARPVAIFAQPRTVSAAGAITSGRSTIDAWSMPTIWRAETRLGAGGCRKTMHGGGMAIFRDMHSKLPGSINGSLEAEKTTPIGVVRVVRRTLVC